MPDFEEVFADWAESLRQAQHAIIHEANRPETVKVLRRFSSPELAQMLGLSDTEYKHWRSRKDFPRGVARQGRYTYSMTDVLDAHSLLNASMDAAKRSRPVRPEGTAMSVISMSNFKGGCGKSTQSVLFAQHAARAGYRVLLIDLDVQGSATSMFGIDPSQVDTIQADNKTHVPGSLRSIGSWILDRETIGMENAIRSCIQQTYWPNIAIVPASAYLHKVEEVLARRSDAARRGEATGPVPFYDELGSFLRMMDGNFDIAILDCRPDVNHLTTNAVLAATGLVIPARCDNVDSDSFSRFLAFMTGLSQSHKKMYDRRGLDLEFVKIVPTMFQPNTTAHADALALLAARYPDLVLNAEMVSSSAVTAAGNEKRTIYEWTAPSNSRHSLQRALASADRVNRAIETEIRRVWGAPPDPVSLPFSPADRTVPGPLARHSAAPRKGEKNTRHMEAAE